MDNKQKQAEMIGFGAVMGMVLILFGLFITVIPKIEE